MANLPDPEYANEIDLAKILPRSIKNFFWEGIADALSTELTNLRGYINELNKTYDLNYQTLRALDNGSLDHFIELAKMFGYNIDLSLENDPYILSELVRSIVTLVKRKTTYIGYDIVYSLAKHQGGTFNLYWNGKQLFRATENINNLLNNDEIDRISEFPFITEERNYSQFIEGDKLLDLDPPLILDDDVVWYLDQLFSRLTTKHLAFEIYAGSFPVIPQDIQVEPNFYFSFARFGTAPGSPDTSFPIVYADYTPRERFIGETLGPELTWPGITFDLEDNPSENVKYDIHEFNYGTQFNKTRGALISLTYFPITYPHMTASFWFKINQDVDITKFTTILALTNGIGLYIIEGVLTVYFKDTSDLRIYEIGLASNYKDIWTYIYFNTTSDKVFINGVEITLTDTESDEYSLSGTILYFNQEVIPYAGFTTDHELIDISYNELYLFFGDNAIDLDEAEEELLMNRFYHAKFPLCPINFHLLPTNELADTPEFCLMTTQYMEYLSNGIEYNRKLTEVPHIGVQVPLFLSRFSIHYANLKTLAFTALTEDYDNDMIPGNIIGELVVSTNPEAIIEDGQLVGEFNRIIISPESCQSTSNELWHYITTWIQANTVSEKLPFVGDGIETEFTGKLNYAPIVRHSVKFKYEVEGQAGLVREVIDRFEDPVGFYTESAEQVVTTNKLFAKDAILSIQYACPEPNVIENSFILKFTIDGVLYNILDTVTVVGETGIFDSPYIDSSEIDYLNRTVTVTFNRLTDFLEDVIISYQFREFDVSTVDRRAYAELNYETGDYTLFTKYVRQNNEVISTTSLTTINNYTLSGAFFGPITPGTVVLSYYTTDGVLHTATDVQDSFLPEFGYFTGTNIDNNSGSGLSNTARIRYKDGDENVGELYVEFFNPTSFVNNVEVDYEYTLLSPVANGTEIFVDYESEMDIPIRSVGLTNNEGEFIAYAQIPPIVLGSSKFHTSFEWYIYRGEEEFK